MELPKTYDPARVEERWYRHWMEQGYFLPRNPDRPPYAITIPPPNITGSLHMGHALCYAIHDVLVRRKRMGGFHTLCLPGTDHAGIATQNVVEKVLAKEGKHRHALGREKFLERVWQWKEEYGSRIIEQFQRMGFSFDWSRLRFTMDEGYVDAILEMFVRWWEDGHIYRGKRVINWCPRCRSAISDIEVEMVERAGHLYHFRYPFADGSGHVTIATTRPETMLGDTAVAAHPEDERYKGRFGKKIRLPLTGREIELIADDYADPEFGTGAVKVTPAHDLNDFEIGLRHGLARIVVIGEDGRMTEAAGSRYAGLDRFEARRRVLDDLEREALLEKVEDYPMQVPTCERCHTVIEPLLSEQWFVRMKEIAAPAIAAVEEGRIRFVPERYTRIYLDWMKNIRDWCISRQLWWGHRIPVWYTDDGETIVARNEAEARAKAGGRAIRRDPDVLDTWFSSALWPFATLGWPKETDDLATFYPTDILITAQEIIYLWVARMIMTGLYFMGEIPFREVYIYATVLNEEGRRMSKSLGTGIDPLELIDRYGADALRYALLAQTGKNQDIRFSEKRVEVTRNFCNKIWNAARFVLLHLEGAPSTTPAALEARIGEADLPLADRWIISRLQKTNERVDRALDAYDIDKACQALYTFLWDEFCDWYLELTKPRLAAGGEGADFARAVLAYTLERTMRLFHPIMPHITEEIWQTLPHEGASIMIAPWPEPDPGLIDEEAEEEMALFTDVVRAVRHLRATARIEPRRPVSAVIVPKGEGTSARLSAMRPEIEAIARLSSLALADHPPTKRERAIFEHLPLAGVYLPLADLIDVEGEIGRLESELAAARKDLGRVEKKLANEKFLARAPEAIVARERRIAAELAGKIATLTQRIEMLRS